MVKHGGPRPNAGRKKGTPLKAERVYFKDFWSEKEKLDLIAHVKSLYKGNPKMTMSVVEHIYGRPAQALSFEGSVSHNINIRFLIHDGHRYQPTLTSPETGRDLEIPSEV